MSLKENKCEACRIGAPLVTAVEKEEFFKAVSYTHLTLPTNREV